MLEKLKQLENKYLELSARAEQPDFYADPARAAKFLKEQRELEPIVTAYRAWRACAQNMDDALAMMTGEQDEALKALCQEEYQENKARREELEQQLKLLLLPRDPNDEKNVLMEIRVGVGGEESALFAHSLFRMYAMYAAARGWKLELLNYTETELGGIKEADFLVSGAGAYSRLKFESGVHRVQRVPETESGGRVHTSTATVAVLPEMEAADVELRPEDIEMQVYRMSIKPPPPCGSSISRRALSSPARRSAARSRIGKSAWPCWPPSSIRSSRSGSNRRQTPPAAARSAPGCATNASAPTTFPRAG